MSEVEKEVEVGCSCGADSTTEVEKEVVFEVEKEVVLEVVLEVEEVDR